MATLKRGQLCETCLKHLNEQLTIGDINEQLHHNDYSSLRSAADAGCYICLRLSMRVDLFEKDPTSFGSTLIRQESIPLGVTKGFTYLICFKDGSLHWCEFILFPQSSPLCGPVILPQTTRNSSSMHQAEVWLSRCRRTHKSCWIMNQSVAKKDLPTRLLSVKLIHGRLRIRLEETRCFPSAPDLAYEDYVSFSHAWGEHKFLTLTKNNYLAFMKEIPLEALSKSFQDAVSVTHALGMTYIWIDSLCIVQDDPDDWQKESTRMANVYQHAILNISASGFPSGVEGFMPAIRKPDPSPPLLSLDADQSEQVFVFSEKRPWRSLWGSPLFQRGWIWQEQILAARALHFGNDQIYWECREDFATEVFPEGWKLHGVKPEEARNSEATPSDIFGSLYSEDHILQPFWHFSLHSAEDVQQRDHYDIFALWAAMIQEYSTRDFTYLKDRSIALLGLASAIHRLQSVDTPLENEYEAGLWRKNLHRGLLWREMAVESEAKDVPDWASYSSWSWLSCKSPVEWREVWPSYLHHMQIRHKLIRILDGAPDLPSSTLQIKGHPIKLHTMREPPRLQMIHTDMISYFTIPVIVHGLTTTFSFDPDYWFVKKIYGEPDDSQEMIKTLIQNTIMLPTLYWRKLDNTVGIDCLLLNNDESIGKGLYRRVGIAMIDATTLMKRDYDKPGDVEAETRLFWQAYNAEVMAAGYMLKDDDVLQRSKDGMCVVGIV